MKKIAVIGGHGVGKTTLCEALHEYVFKQGKESILIDEVVRKCPYPINDNMCNETAMWTVSRQIYEEVNAASKKQDYIICDRSSIDPVMYLVRAMAKKGEVLFEDEVVSEFFHFAVKWLDSYQKIVLVTGFDASKQVDDGVRSTDKDFGEDMDGMFQEVFCGNENLLLVQSSDIFSGDIEKLCKIIIS